MFKHIFKNQLYQKLKIKKMELSTTLIGLFITALCIAPFLWFSYTNKQHKKQIINSLSSDPTTKITSYEFCGDMALAYSATENRVFFYKKTKEQTITQAIQLADFKSCQVAKISDHQTNGQHQNIKKMYLTFHPKNPNQHEVTLPIYNADESMIIGGELLFVEKWAHEIQEKMK